MTIAGIERRHDKGILVEGLKSDFSNTVKSIEYRLLGTTITKEEAAHLHDLINEATQKEQPLTSLIIAKLTSEEYDKLMQHKISYSGATGKAVSKDDGLGPYIASFPSELAKVLQVLNWEQVEIKVSGQQITIAHAISSFLVNKEIKYRQIIKNLLEVKQLLDTPCDEQTLSSFAIYYKGGAHITTLDAKNKEEALEQAVNWLLEVHRYM